MLLWINTLKLWLLIESKTAGEDVFSRFPQQLRTQDSDLEQRL